MFLYRRGGWGPSGGGSGPMAGRPETGGQWDDVGPWTEHTSASVEKMMGRFKYLCATEKKYARFMKYELQLHEIATRIWDKDLKKQYKDMFQNFTQTKTLMQYVHDDNDFWAIQDKLQRITTLMDAILANITETAKWEDWLNYIQAFTHEQDKNPFWHKVMTYDYNLKEPQSNVALVPYVAGQGDSNVPELSLEVPKEGEEEDEEDDEENEQDENDDVAKLGKRTSTTKLNVPDPTKPRIDMSEANLNGFHTDYDVDYIATRLDRLRDW